MSKWLLGSNLSQYVISFTGWYFFTPAEWIQIKSHNEPLWILFKFSSWLMVNSLIWYFAHLQSATKFASMLQDNVGLNVRKGRKFCISTNCLTYSRFLYVIEFCEIVMFKPWTQYVWSKTEILFFFATCTTSFRIMTSCFTMWVNRYSAKDSVYLVFARS